MQYESNQAVHEQMLHLQVSDLDLDFKVIRSNKDVTAVLNFCDFRNVCYI